MDNSSDMNHLKETEDYRRLELSRDEKTQDGSEGPAGDSLGATSVEVAAAMALRHQNNPFAFLTNPNNLGMGPLQTGLPPILELALLQRHQQQQQQQEEQHRLAIQEQAGMRLMAQAALMARLAPQSGPFISHKAEASIGNVKRPRSEDPPNMKADKKLKSGSLDSVLLAASHIGNSATVPAAPTGGRTSKFPLPSLTGRGYRPRVPTLASYKKKWELLRGKVEKKSNLSKQDREELLRFEFTKAVHRSRVPVPKGDSIIR